MWAVARSAGGRFFKQEVQMRLSLLIPAVLVFLAASYVGAPEARAASVTPSAAPAVTQETATPVHYRRYRHRGYRHYGYGYGFPFYFSFGHHRHRHWGHRRYRNYGGYYRGHRRHRHHRRHWNY
jgi:hypothetical protein